ncbi:MAG TPA: hypothetical protein VGX76_02595, partial [Pirellulales bacterium]|nr:hypothetical protein [Pirellulales bacterium]
RAHESQHARSAKAQGTSRVAEPPPTSDRPAKGPLQVHPTNARYFSDGSGKAVFLTGSHTWANLQDITYEGRGHATFDFPANLAFLKEHRHNFFRLWAWESAFNPGARQGTTTYDPLPYQRPGPGNAADGRPKFDLSLFEPSYFDRLRARVSAAHDEGIYVAVMLFQGFSIAGKGNLGGDPWIGRRAPGSVLNSLPAAWPSDANNFSTRLRSLHCMPASIKFGSSTKPKASSCRHASAPLRPAGIRSMGGKSMPASLPTHPVTAMVRTIRPRPPHAGGNERGFAATPHNSAAPLPAEGAHKGPSDLGIGRLACDAHGCVSPSRPASKLVRLSKSPRLKFVRAG